MNAVTELVDYGGCELLALSKSDTLVTALGYETRCTYATEFVANHRGGDFASRKIAVTFSDRRVGAYDRNRKIFLSYGFKIVDWESTDVLNNLLHQVLEESSNNISGTSRLIIDISSMSRPMIARFFEWSLEALHGGVKVIFVYSPAKFYPPPEISAPMEAFGPISGEFRGWSAKTSWPVSLVLGMGYEFERAFGVIEHLDAFQTYFFFPTGIAEFDRATINVNAPILNLTKRSKILHYSLEQPGTSFVKLRSLVGKLVECGRPVIVPLGPKIFTLLALTVSEFFGRSPAVWRVSMGKLEAPHDRLPNGNIIVSELRRWTA